ncbi:MAG: glycosyltransferase family 2 protein [Candidatus Heimdallarchaeota archaeon]
MVHKPSLVSIVLPTHNRGHLISRAIKSILRQTYDNFEVIIVDDGSIDNTEPVVLSFNDSRIRYLRRNENLGGSSARNMGIKASKGKFIAFLDSDDIWLPQKLERQMRIFEESSPKVGVVYCEWAQFKGEKLRGHRYIKKKVREGDIHKLIDNYDFFIPTPTILLRKSCLEKTGLFDERFRAQEDFDLLIRLSRHYHFRYIKTPLVIQYHTGVLRYKARVKTNFLLLKKYPHLFENNKGFLFNYYFHTGKYFFFEKNEKKKIWQNYLRYALKINPISFYSIKIFILYFSGYLVEETKLHGLFQTLYKKISSSIMLWILKF